MIFLLPLVLLALHYNVRPTKVATVSGAGGFAMGFSLRRINWNKMAKVAMKYGPAIAQLTPIGPQVALAMNLANAARAGDPGALAKVVAIQQGAAAGDQKATEELALMKVAKIVRAKAQESQQQQISGDAFNTPLLRKRLAAAKAQRRQKVQRAAQRVRASRALARTRRQTPLDDAQQAPDQLDDQQVPDDQGYEQPQEETQE